MHTSKTISALPILIAFSVILTATRGFYAQWAITGIIAIFCVLLALYAANYRLKLESQDIPTLVLTHILLLTCTPQLLYPTSVSWNIRISMMGISASSICMILIYTHNKKTETFGFWFVLGMLGCMRLMPIFGDPIPNIDVYFVYQAAAHAAMLGMNPYEIIINSPVHQMRYFTPWFPYPPGIFYLLIPAVWIFHDPRYVAVFVDVGIAYCVAKEMKPPLRYWIAILMLSFPLALFVIEQSYLDTLSILSIFLLWVSIRHRRWVLGGVAAAFALSTKQYLIVALIPYVQTIMTHKKYYPAFIGFSLYAIYTIGPFAIANPSSLIMQTVISILGKELPRLDGLSIYPFLAAIHIRYSSMILITMSVLTAAIMVRAMQRRGVTLVGATGMILFAAFVWGPRSFINYYFPVYMLMLIESIIPHTETKEHV